MLIEVGLFESLSVSLDRCADIVLLSSGVNSRECLPACLVERFKVLSLLVLSLPSFSDDVGVIPVFGVAKAVLGRLPWLTLSSS